MICNLDYKCEFIIKLSSMFSKTNITVGRIFELYQEFIKLLNGLQSINILEKSGIIPIIHTG